MLPHNKRRFWCLPFLVNFWMVFLQHCMADGKADVAVPRVRSHPENEKVDLWSSPISSDATDLYNVYLRSSFLDTLSPFSTHQVTFYQSSNSDDLSFEVEKVREMPASSRFSTSVIGVHDFGTGTNPDTKNSVLINHRDEEQTRYSQVERQVSFHHLDNFQFSSTLSIPWALRTIICLTCEQSRTFNSETIVGSKQEASFQVLRNNLYGSVAFSSSDSLRLNLETKYEFQIQSTSEIAYLADGSPVLSNVLSSNISDLLKATLSISPSPVDVGRFKTFEVSKGLVNELSSSNIVNLYTFNLPNETCRFSPIGSLTFVNLSPRLPHLTSCISDKDVEIKRPTLPINEESTQFTSSKRIHVFTEDIFLMPHHSESVFSYSSAIYSSEMSDNGETVVQESHMFYTEQIPDTVVEISNDTFWRATYSRNLISDEDKYYILSPEQSSKRLAVSTDLPAEIFTTNNVEANSAKTKFPKQMISSSFISSNDFSNHLHVWSNTAFIQQTLSVSLSEFENHTYFSSQTTIIHTFSTPIDTDELAVPSLFVLQLNSAIHPDVPVENSTIIHSNVLVGYNTTLRSTMSRQRNTIIHYNIPRQHNNTVLSNVLIQDDSSVIPNYSVRYKSKTYLNITKQLDTVTEVNALAHVSTEVDSAIESDIAMYVNRTAMFYIPTESDNLTELDIPTEHSSIRESDVSIQHDVSMELDNLTASNVSPDAVNPKGLPVPLKPDNPAGFDNVTISGILTRHDNPKEFDKLIDHDTVAHSDSPTSLNVPTRPDNPTELENLAVSDISTQFYIQVKYDTALQSNTPVELRTSVAFDIPTFDDNSKESRILTYPDIRANLVDPQNIAPVGVHKLIDDPESHTFKFYNPNDTTKDNYSVLNLLPNEQFISKTVNKYFTADENENTIEDYGINPHLRISSIVAVKPTKVYRDFQEMPSLSLELSSSSDPDSRNYILESSSTAISKFNLNFFISPDITQNLIWNKLSSNVAPVKASLYVADDIHSHGSSKTRSSGYSKQEEATIKQTDTLISTIFQSTYTLKSTDIPWYSAQASEVHSTRNENKMDDETTSFEETLSSTSKFHAFDETTSVWNIDKATIFPSSETEVYSQVPFIPFYISLAMLMSWARFCSVKETLRREIAWILSSVLNEPILPGQVCFKNAQEQCEAVIHRNNEEDMTKSKSIDVFVYMNDKNGKYDLVLTRRSAHVLQQEAGKSNTLVYHSSVHRVDTYLQERHFKRPTPHTTSGVIATVTISCIGGACLLLLCILLVVMKQRLDQPRNCSPTYDSYSLESFSTISSFQRRRGRRSSLCSFVNQAFQDPDGLSHPLDTSSLAVFTSNMEAINQEFKKIPMNMPRVDEALPGTEVKNRYANIIPVPETRVFLKPRPGEPHSDYINANYVRGYDGKSIAYIATQGPLLETISSFWQMVWEQKCQVIIMLTQLSEKGMPRCAPYFPSKLTDCDRSYGQYQVSLKKKEIDENYTISMFHLRRTDLNECRDITHFWYTNWPVHGVPSDVYKVISFLLEARVYMNSSSSPTVVHCSPGTGRTGVIIALDSCIRQYEESQTVDVARSVYKLRRDRGGAVQNMEQYVFIYQALREYVCNILHEPYNPTVVCSS